MIRRCGSPTSPPPGRRSAGSRRSASTKGCAARSIISVVWWRSKGHAEVRHSYLVTGAAGFIGSHVSEALIARGAAVTGVDNFDAFYARDVKERNLAGLVNSPSFRFVEADVARDPMPLDGIEAIIHLAAKPGVRPSLEDPAAYMEANVTPTAPIFNSARLGGVTRVGVGPSSSLYGTATQAPFAE